ncbi:MAG TPA: glucosamine-6-phosphate deaminase [Cyclobacteriaceae bacterium]|nr:glucosamine-6-phosphate deaminase [Cyclobacteriaceae bacterium]
MKYPVIYTKDKLIVRILETPVELGQNAAKYVESKLDETIRKRSSARIIIATGASQFELYKSLKKCNIDWKKITVFHLDEYAGMPASHPASFRKYLKERILDLVNPFQVHFLAGDAADLEAESVRYAGLLMQGDIDLACIGIGENGHIAFNDPPVADFDDPKMVKLVKLDDDCKKQQMGEGWFPTIGDVPTHALSLTVPAIMRAKKISCVVPDQRKAKAVKNTVEGPVATSCPASILRTHPDAILWLDKDSASLLEP